MKKIFFSAVVLMTCLSFKVINAQVRFNIGVNIGAQPEWGAVGYSHVDYYYMPDIGVYYDVPVHQYVYFDNNVWVHTPYLPVRYRNYDVYHSYKVVINRPRPWFYDRDYRTRYWNYRGRRDQIIIRDSRDERYRNHWHEDNGRHNGWYKNGYEDRHDEHRDRERGEHRGHRHED